MYNYKQLRNEHGLTAAELAERLDMSEKGVRMWETGERHPTIPKLIQLADMFGVSVDYILGREKPVEVQEEQTKSEEQIVPNLTDDEADILRIYRLLDRRAQHELMMHMYGLEDNLRIGDSATTA